MGRHPYRDRAPHAGKGDRRHRTRAEHRPGDVDDLTALTADM